MTKPERNRSAREVAQEVASRIPLRELLPCYSYKRLRGDEPTFPKESSALRARGFLGLNDLHEFAHWKSTRSSDKTRINEESAVAAVTGVALQLIEDRNLPVSVPISVLTVLHGVRVPTASVILTVWDPTRFGIIDVNAWSALFDARAQRAPNFEPRDYERYIDILTQISGITGLSARQVDMGLWVWWKQKKGANRGR